MSTALPSLTTSPPTIRHHSNFLKNLIRSSTLWIGSRRTATSPRSKWGEISPLSYRNQRSTMFGMISLSLPNLLRKLPKASELTSTSSELEKRSCTVPLQKIHSNQTNRCLKMFTTNTLALTASTPSQANPKKALPLGSKITCLDTIEGTKPTILQCTLAGPKNTTSLADANLLMADWNDLVIVFWG